MDLMVLGLTCVGFLGFAGVSLFGLAGMGLLGLGGVRLFGLASDAGISGSSRVRVILIATAKARSSRTGAGGCGR